MEKRIRLFFLLLIITIFLNINNDFKTKELEILKQELERLENYRFEEELLNREITYLKERKNKILDNYLKEEDINSFIHQLEEFIDEKLVIKTVDRIKNNSDDIEKDELQIYLTSTSLESIEEFLFKVTSYKKNIVLKNLNLSREDHFYIVEILIEINIGFDNNE